MIEMKEKSICVRGNKEKYILEGMPLVVHDEMIKISQEQLDKVQWIKDNLSDSSIEYIKKLPKEVIYEIEGKKIYIVHYPMNEQGNFKKHIKEATACENEEMFLGIEADIFLYGHTHRSVYNTKNNKVYINPGALGCPEKSNMASCGILNISNSNIEYKQLNIKYNVKEVVNDIRKVAFPGYKWVLKLFYGEE